MRVIKNKVQKILSENGIQKPEFKREREFTTFVYETKDIFGDVVAKTVLSYDGYLDLPSIKRTKINENAYQEIDHKAYKKYIKKFNKDKELYDSKFNDLVEEEELKLIESGVNVVLVKLLVKDVTDALLEDLEENEICNIETAIIDRLKVECK